MPKSYPAPTSIGELPTFKPAPDELAQAFEGDRHAWLGGAAIRVHPIYAGHYEDYLDDLGTTLDDESLMRLEEHAGVLLGQTENGDTVLLAHRDGTSILEVVGYYTGPQLMISSEYQSRGLGTLLVIARALYCGESPQSAYDKVGYSPEGLRVHEVAWDRAQQMLAEHRRCEDAEMAPARVRSRPRP